MSEDVEGLVQTTGNTGCPFHSSVVSEACFQLRKIARVVRPLCDLARKNDERGLCVSSGRRRPELVQHLVHKRSLKIPLAANKFNQDANYILLPLYSEDF